MSKDRFYVLYFNEDGDPPDLTVYDSAAELEEAITNDEITKFIDGDKGCDFSCETGHLIIRGKAVMPKPKKIVSSWSVE